MMMRKWMISAGLVLLLTPALGLAMAPVEDYSEAASDSQDGGVSLSRPARAPQPSMSDRLQRLEAKLDNLSQANLSARVEELQQTVQELRGQLEKQSHDLELLSANQKTFYQDINTRITQANQSAPAAAAKTAVDSAPVPSSKASAANAKSNVAPADAVAAETKEISADENSVSPSTTAKASSVAAQSTAGQSSTETGLYQQGFALLKSKQYDRALTQLKEYVSKYPQGHYAVNAHFWMGEINYLQGKHAAAKKSFETVVKNYPKDSKIPDALLKLAIIATDMGQKQKAEEMLAQIQKQYPGTTAARLAMIRAQELRLSMH